MRKISKISESEWEILKVLWNCKPATSKEIKAKLSNEWNIKTVRTLIKRLEKKEVVAYKIQDKLYHYYPLFTEEECLAAKSESFVERFFDGTLVPMMAHFVKHQKITPAEKKELLRILEEEEED